MQHEKPYYEHANRRVHIRHWVLGQMLAGAGKAALFVIAIGVVLGAIYLVSLALPEQSKQAPSPQQTGALQMPVAPAVAA
ncbi:MAG: RC-LH1 core complex protein PufX [Rhodobacter sp.]|jgi:hypothetical protein|nr:RC-LH1 core complex protein PufX [Rhodobacter sp.]MCA3487644.1 RC-LH1 core complex protein PufX [Rhodobacter sp.]MCA3493137.1 RC-LH1 core complex protein PufX [Rhodobacter sp.]MCA3498683.1 RC-LH1 core complex protein PufX [Rhodobacter sp.]MCA3503103.1 RC-LH1 core complex protein PufX [Rhodobacter sp.]